MPAVAGTNSAASTSLESVIVATIAAGPDGQAVSIAFLTPIRLRAECGSRVLGVAGRTDFSRPLSR